MWFYYFSIFNIFKNTPLPPIKSFKSVCELPIILQIHYGLDLFFLYGLCFLRTLVIIFMFTIRISSYPNFRKFLLNLAIFQRHVREFWFLSRPYTHIFNLPCNIGAYPPLSTVYFRNLFDLLGNFTFLSRIILNNIYWIFDICLWNIWRHIFVTYQLNQNFTLIY